MKLCVNIDGADIEEDLVVMSGDLELWLRIEPGYEIKAPSGTFSIGDKSAAGLFPRLPFKASSGGSCSIRFVSEPLPGPPSVAGGPPLNEVIERARTLTFVSRGRVVTICLAALVAVLAALFFAWKLGVVLENGKDAVKSIWPLDTLFPLLVTGVTGLLAVADWSWKSPRTWFLTHHRLSLALAALVAAISLGVPWFSMAVVTNGSPEKVPFDGGTAELDPQTSTLVFSSQSKVHEADPFEACQPGSDCKVTDRSATSLLLRLLTAETTVIHCLRKANQKPYEDQELKNAKTCRPDPLMIIERDPSNILPKLVTSAEAAPTAQAAEARDQSGIHYELQPFAPGIKQTLGGLSGARVMVSLAKDQSSALSELVLDGNDLLSHVHIQLPTSDKREAYGPWLPTESPLVNGRVFSGSLLVGKLACAVPANSPTLSIDFAPSRSHLKRVSLEKLTALEVDKGNFYQSFEVERPELVTHVPWCSSSTPNLDRYAMDLYLDDSWTPDNWSITLPLNVVSVHVHGADGRYAGKLVVSRAAGAGPLPLQLVSYAISASVKVWQATTYQWEAYQPSHGEYASAVFAFAGDENFAVELSDGSKRRTEKNTDKDARLREFRLEPLPLRRCYIDRKTNLELRTPGQSCSSKDTAAWFHDFPHVDCAVTSELCQ